MGQEYDPIYISDVMPELANQRDHQLSAYAAAAACRPLDRDKHAETQKMIGALIAIEVILVLCSLAVVVWIMTSNVSLM
jgi:hypothetical protein